ncbi:MAG TPA: GAF domain-containing protein [Chroococcidiopsis sp.]
MRSNSLSIPATVTERLLRKLSAIAQQIHQGLDLDQILDNAVQATRDLLHSDRALIYRLLPHGDAVIAFESVAEGWRPITGQMVYDPCLKSKWVGRYQEGQITAIANAQTKALDPCYRDLLNRLQVKANLVVPIVCDGQLWGLLIIHQCGAPRTWQSMEVQLVKQMSLQMAIAIQQDQLRQRLAQAEQALESPVQERQTAEENLRRYERIVSATPDCVSLLDRHYIYQAVNQAYLSWHCKTTDEIVGHSVGQLLGEDWFLTLIKPLLDRCLSGQGEQVLENWADYCDGKRRFVRATYTPYIERNDACGDTIAGVLVNVHDLTDLKLVEEALSRSEARYRAIVENSPDIIERFDTNLRHLYVSPSLTRITGIPAEVFLGKTCRDLGMDERMIQTWEAAVLRLLQTGQKQTVEFDAPTLTGRRSFEMVIAPELTQDGAIASILSISRDVTERKHTEAALRMSEERLHLALEASGEGLWDWNIATGEVYRSPLYLELLGYAPNEWPESVGTWEAAIHPDDFAGMIDRLTHHMQDGNVPYFADYRVRSKTGSWLWISDYGKVVSRDASGQPVRMIGTFKDISDRKRAESALQFSQATFQALVTNMPGMVYRYFPEINEHPHHFTFVSPYAYGLLGVTPPQLIEDADRFVALIHPSDLPVFLSSVAYAVAHELPWHWEGRITTPAGQLKWIQGHSQAMHAPEGIAWDGLLIDISDRKATEAALQELNRGLEQRVQQRTETLQQQAEQERLLRLITQRIHESFDLNEILATALSETRQTLQANRVAIYQFNPDWSGSFVAESVEDCWVPLVGSDIKRVWEDTHLKQTQGGRYRNHETFAVNDIYTVGHRSCHIALLEQFQAKAYAIAPIFVHETLWGLLATYQNTAPRQWQPQEISLLQQIAVRVAIAIQQSQLYQASQAHVQELERLNQIKDDFLSTVSHELRSPMANIKMATQMLELQLTRQGVLHHGTDTPINRYFRILREEGQREIHLINDLLDLARLDANTQPLTAATIHLAAWVEQMAAAVFERTQQQQQRLILDVPTNLTFDTDLTYLERILSELLHNACKYTPAGETIAVSAQACHALASSCPEPSDRTSDPSPIVAPVIQLRVCNSGVEIPPEECDRIFDKFYRIPNNDPWKHGGTGLGLALVKKLTERINGSIRVESGNRQTCFELTLGSIQGM